ncbi:MAG: ATP-binding cassette domain-containing protein [Firmicutes bacterium]|nr:ATP-binding cassette domain-containing protein [Bacillota bacterium]
MEDNLQTEPLDSQVDDSVVLRTDKLTKVYGGKKVINEVSLSVKEGSIYGLIGKNGSGKTTLMRIITGLAPPTSGKVFLSENYCSGKGRLNLSAVIEYPAFYPYMTAYQNLMSQQKVIGIRDKNLPNKLISSVGLCGGIEKKKVKDYSLGMKQRLSIAEASIGKPLIMLLDEPTNGLDPTGIKNMRERMLELAKSGVTLIVSSHILGELWKVSTHYGVLNNGMLIDEFSKEELLKKVRSCIRLRVNDVSKSIEILSTNLNINDYKIDEKEISIYDNVDISRINEELVKNDLIIESITSEHGDYEEYFIKLMGGNV